MESASKVQQTIGQKRVRASFNPGNNSLVDQIKEKAAEFIDLVQTIRGDGRELMDGEKARLLSLAQTEAESAAMWAVKAATF